MAADCQPDGAIKEGNPRPACTKAPETGVTKVYAGSVPTFALPLDVSEISPFARRGVYFELFLPGKMSLMSAFAPFERRYWASLMRHGI